MKIAHFSYSDLGSGASRAAYRIFCALRNKGLSGCFLVKEKLTDDADVKPIPNGFIRNIPLLKNDRNLLKLYNSDPHNFWSVGLVSQLSSFSGSKHIQNSDIISLYWICGGLLSVKQIGRLLDSGKPVVWRLSDLWPFTGGCHFSGDCAHYEKRCGNCPQLKSSHNLDLSRLIWRQKYKHWSKGSKNLTIVCPSNWIAECAKKSALFGSLRIEVIPSAVNTKIFKPAAQKEARSILNLPCNKNIILFGAARPHVERKGIHYFIKALEIVKAKTRLKDIEVVMFGSWKSDNINLPYPVHTLGKFFNDFSLPLLYAASDIFVAPSLQDNLPNTVLESMACGTPCVAFDIGGLSDAIDHLENGYLAAPQDPEDMANGIALVLEQKEKMKAASIAKIERNFELEKAAEKYISLYQALLN